MRRWGFIFFICDAECGEFCVVLGSRVEYTGNCCIFCMTDGLEKLFGTPARVKLLRLFLFNPRQTFSTKDIATRARVTDREVRRELNLLTHVKIVDRLTRGRGIRFGLNQKFEYALALQNLLLNAPRRADDIVKRMRGIGTLRMIILSGIFMGGWEDRLDILVVGDKVKERLLRERIRNLESEIGKEIRFALLSSEDFFYRLNMNDKLVRDVLDYPHAIVLDRLNIGIK